MYTEKSNKIVIQILIETGIRYLPMPVNNCEILDV